MELAKRYEPSLVQLSIHSFFFSKGVNIYIYIYIILVSIKLKPRTLQITEVLTKFASEPNCDSDITKTCMTLHEPDTRHKIQISCFKMFLFATSTTILGPVGIISNDLCRSLPWRLRRTVVSLLTFICSEVKSALIFL